MLDWYVTTYMIVQQIMRQVQDSVNKLYLLHIFMYISSQQQGLLLNDKNEYGNTYLKQFEYIIISYVMVLYSN